MVDYFTIALTHGLMAIALWRLLWRDDLDRERGTAPAQRGRAAAGGDDEAGQPGSESRKS